jgi:hypothetical protein
VEKTPTIFLRNKTDKKLKKSPLKDHPKSTNCPKKTWDEKNPTWTHDTRQFVPMPRPGEAPE